MAIFNESLLQEVLGQQRLYFNQNNPIPISERIANLKTLKSALKKNHSKILKALHVDLGRGEAEALLGEVGVLNHEIDFTIKNLAEWAQPKKVSTPWELFRTKSVIYREPLGQTLIIAPWNYPIQLLLAPWIASLAAGNTAILKPSELAPACSEVIKNLIEENFPSELVWVAEGGVEVSQALLKEKFDHIFFTGGEVVGKVIMKAAAEHLTPVTLELGGKSPCIVDSDADLKIAAQRITWGKFFNAGQTCVAPDYAFVPKAKLESFVEEMKNALDYAYGSEPKKSEDFGRIINSRHWERLKGYLGQGKIAIGGKVSEKEKYISPTLLIDVKATDPVMQEEIFGPILPVMTYENLDEVIAFVKSRSKPLALYLFSENAKTQKRILEKLSYGGGCINDALIHLGNPKLPFGGVGKSGMGSYHGETGFLTFSHQKSVCIRPLGFDLPLRYPPYASKVKWLRWIFAGG
jgi:aldehyde dehydrogenase (NAD+)